MEKKDDDTPVRVTIAANALRDGRIRFRDEDRQLAEELLSAPRGPTGVIILKGLSQRTIAMARSMYLAVSLMQQQDREVPKVPESFDAAAAQAELFRLFAILFVALTGEAAEHTTYEEIQPRMLELLKGNPNSYGKRVNNALDEIAEFYNTNRLAMFRAAKTFGGMKAVTGGQRRFTESTLDGVRITGLYLDTQLVPDPVYPFIAADLKLNAAPLQLAHVLFFLLQLEPLVNAQLAVPAVFVFPSFEESLEERDPTTQAGIANLAFKVLAPACDATVESIADVQEFAGRNPEQFLRNVMRERRFVPQAGDTSTTYTWQEAVELHLNNTKGIVSEEYWNQQKSMPPENLVLLNTLSRVRGQFHLLENADEMQAQPLLTLPVQWHYFELCSDAGAQELVKDRILSPQALTTLRALQDDSLGWLGNIPIAGLVDLRQNLEHAAFRDELRKATAQLTNAGTENLEEVVREVNHSLKMLVDKQKRAIRDIEDKYSSKAWGAGLGVAGGALTAVTVAFMPSLAAFLGPAAPAAPFMAALGTGALALAKEKVGELADKRRSKRTMLGMLATAYYRKG